MVQFTDPISGGSTLRLVFDAQNAGQTTGYIFGLDNVLFRIVAPGDTDGNGEVNSTDLFNILGAGKFNHPELGPGTWGEGDFTGDTLINSADLFAMLSAAKFNAGPYTTATPPAAMAAVPEPSTFMLAVFGLVALVAFAWRRRAKCIGYPDARVCFARFRHRHFTRWSIRPSGDDRCGLLFGKQLEFCPVGHGVRENQFSVVSRSRYNIGQ